MRALQCVNTREMINLRKLITIYQLNKENRLNMLIAASINDE